MEDAADSVAEDMGEQPDMGSALSLEGTKSRAEAQRVVAEVVVVATPII